ncbi:hypothetical protein WL1483_3207 [Aeromonas schubertii]|uniref:Uncharacterized protein n=1 Tax=Aeromonas schubertii TaxID=652 RepID=A0A0S2SLW5_9GAMM|nr:hypothetical protein WL1483_3207 [Aeromonas schubertii]
MHKRLYFLMQRGQRSFEVSGIHGLSQHGDSAKADMMEKLIGALGQCHGSFKLPYLIDAAPNQ